MKRVLLMIFAILFTCTQIIWAQENSITGRATDSNGEPLPGVTIQIKGTNLGTVTQSDGTYRLTLPANATSLIFSFVGMTSREIEIAGQSVINVQMEEEVTALTEIVVVGYNTQKKADITGSVSVVGAEAMAQQPSGNLSKQLAGRAAGVQIATSGDPTGNSTIRIRGIGTINDNGPLLVIDGVSTRDQDLNNINPNDIESLQILKDASSSSIYGAQASNGVIIITTKKGIKGQAKITYNGYVGVQKMSKWYDLLDSDGWVEMWSTATKNSKILSNWGNGINTDRSYEDLFNDASLWANDANYISNHEQFGSADNPDIPEFIVAGDPVTGEWTETNRKARWADTDWGKEISQTGLIQNHQLTGQGGGDAGVYSIGFNYFKQEGVIKTTFMERYQFRANSELKVKNHIKLGENFSLSFNNSHGVGQNQEGWAGSYAYRMVPWVPVYDEAGEFAGTNANGSGNSANPVAVLERAKKNRDHNMRLFGNLFAEVNFLRDFNFKTSFGLDYNDDSGYSMGFPNPESAEPSTTTTYYEYHNNSYRWVFSNTLTYAKIFGNHNLNILIGSEAINDGLGRNLDGTRYGYMYAQDQSTWTLDAGETSGMSNGSSYNDEYSLFGLFARADYAYRNKYLLTGIVRRDGVSRFSDDNRYGVFPSVSLGWRLTEEEFMKSLSAINNAKLRIGYGITGNAQIPNAFNYAYTYGYNANQYNYDLSGSNSGSTVGMRLGSFGNTDTKWEESKMLDIGIDLTALNSAFEVTFDVYWKKTSGMLVQDGYLATAGRADAPYVNLGDMSNKGFDLSVLHRGKIGPFEYDVTATVAHYKNEILKIASSDATKYYGGDSRFGNTTILTKGMPISAFWGYEIEGIYKSEEELGSHAVQPGINNSNEDMASDAWRASLGKFKFKDQNGDDEITSDDKTMIGNPHPDFTYSLDLNVYYKAFELNMFFTGSQGNDIYNYVKYWTDFNGSFVGNRSDYILTDSWKPGMGDTKLPILEINNTTDANYSTSYYVEDGSFLRMKTLQLGYNLPSSLLNKIGIDNMKVYAQMNNVFTITNYSGLDPDLGLPVEGDATDTDADWGKGLDFGNYPSPKSTLIGVIISF